MMAYTGTAACIEPSPICCCGTYVMLGTLSCQHQRVCWVCHPDISRYRACWISIVSRQDQSGSATNVSMDFMDCSRPVIQWCTLTSRLIILMIITFSILNVHRYRIWWMSIVSRQDQSSSAMNVSVDFMDCSRTVIQWCMLTSQPIILMIMTSISHVSKLGSISIKTGIVCASLAAT